MVFKVDGGETDLRDASSILWRGVKVVHNINKISSLTT